MTAGLGQEPALLISIATTDVFIAPKRVIYYFDLKLAGS